MPTTQRTSITAHFIWLSLLALSLIYLFSSLRVVSDVTQFMPDNHQNKNVQLLLDELQQGNTARLLILGIKADNSKDTASLSRQLKIELDKNKLFNLVHNGQHVISSKDFIINLRRHKFLYRIQVISSDFKFPGIKILPGGKINYLNIFFIPILIAPYIKRV